MIPAETQTNIATRKGILRFFNNKGKGPIRRKPKIELAQT